MRRIFLSVMLLTAVAVGAAKQSTHSPVTPAPLDPGGRDLLAKLTLLSRSQVALGGIALQKAKRPDVTAFARQMLADYSRAETELTVMAGAMNVDVKVADLRLRGLEQRLGGATGEEFDREYAQTMFDMNQDVVSLLRVWTIEASKRQADDALTRWAKDMLPKAEQYLDRARQLQQVVK